MGTQALLTRHFSLEQLTPERPVHVLRMRGVRAIARKDERCAGLEQRQWTCADMWRTDAFADKVFSGNSAATCCACSARKRRSARLSQALTRARGSTDCSDTSRRRLRSTAAYPARLRRSAVAAGSGSWLPRPARSPVFLACASMRARPYSGSLPCLRMLRYSSYWNVR